jgi:REP element-mobilizing transposase RayT
MPNHLHAIVVIKNDDSHDSHDSHVETHGRASLHASQPNAPQPNASRPVQLQRKPKSLSSFIAGYKSATINKIDDWIDLHIDISQKKYNCKNKFWQSNYHDHIIRNDNEYRRIKEYIMNNPHNWSDDKFYI